MMQLYENFIPIIIQKQINKKTVKNEEEEEQKEKNQFFQKLHY